MLIYCLLETSEGPLHLFTTWTALFSDPVHPSVWSFVVTLKAPTFPDLMKICLTTDPSLLLSVVALKPLFIQNRIPFFSSTEPIFLRSLFLA